MIHAITVVEHVTIAWFGSVRERRVGVVWHTQGSGKSLPWPSRIMRVGDGESDSRPVHRPQQPRRSALRHFFALLGTAAPAAGPGRVCAPGATPRGQAAAAPSALLQVLEIGRTISVAPRRR